jgi:hypothetical protein
MEVQLSLLLLLVLEFESELVSVVLLEERKLVAVEVERESVEDEVAVV